MSFRKEFLTQPRLRASQRGVLNDPFELSPAQDLIDKALIDGISDEFFTKTKVFLTETDFNQVGVISFTENYNNLLMWSHYANEHKGVVIEFDYHKLQSYLNYKLSTHNSIERVYYNRERYSPLECQVCIKDVLLTKSDDWIYEKEHRVLSSILHVDSVKANREFYEQLHDFYNNIYSELFVIESEDESTVSFHVNPLACTEFDIQDLDGNSTDDNEEMEYSHSELALKEMFDSLSLSPSTVFLFDIPINCITAVFAGCRISDTDLNEISRFARKQQIPVFKAQLSKQHFALEFCRVNV